MPASIANILPVCTDAITRNPVHADRAGQRCNGFPTNFRVPGWDWWPCESGSSLILQHAVGRVDADDSADESARDDVADKVIIHADEADGYERGGDDAGPAPARVGDPNDG